jgi:hypothetical protein
MAPNGSTGLSWAYITIAQPCGHDRCQGLRPISARSCSFPSDIVKTTTSIIVVTLITTTFNVNDVISFVATANDAEDGDLSATLQWGSDVDGNLGSGSSVSATLSAGAHVVTASASDSGGLSGDDTILIQVNDPNANSAAIAHFAYDCNATSCQFDGGASSDVEDKDSALTFVWTFGDGSSTSLQGTSSVSHDYASQGHYTVELVVVDTANESGSASASIQVKRKGSTSGSSGGSNGSGDTPPSGDTSGGNEKGAKKCSDGIDNDNDGAIDGADLGCQ